MRIEWLGLMVLVIGGCKKGEAATTESTATPVASSAAARPTTNVTTGNAPAATTAAAPNAAPGKLLGSCSIGGVACSDYYGAADVTPVKSACQSVGKWSDGACPSGSVGTCTKTEPGGIVNKAHTYAPGTPATAKKTCDNTPGGVYSDG
ncbi:MAG: hypothetical protein U0263_19865 [Polyangiaceae bacterium]